MICIKSAFYLIVLKQVNQYLYMYVFTEKNYNVFYYWISLDQDCYDLVYKTRTNYSTTEKTDMSTGKSNMKTHTNSDELTIWYVFLIQLNKTQTVLFCIKSLFQSSKKMKFMSPESFSWLVAMG